VNQVVNALRCYLGAFAFYNVLCGWSSSFFTDFVLMVTDADFWFIPIVTGTKRIVAKPSPRDSFGNFVITHPNHIVTHPNRIVTGPKRIVTSPNRIATRPKRIVTDPEHIVTHPKRIVTDPEHIVTHPKRIVTDPKRIAARPNHIVTVPKLIVTGSKHIVAKHTSPYLLSQWIPLGLIWEGDKGVVENNDHKYLNSRAKSGGIQRNTCMN